MTISQYEGGRGDGAGGQDGGVERVAGVDGCPGGWVAAVWDSSGVSWRALPLAFGPMLDGLADCAVVAVDVPIGMPETGRRACDLAARETLGAARSSVFLTPGRAVLEAPDYATACAVGRDREGWAPSKQLWFIGDRIRDASRAFSVREAQPGCVSDMVVVEAHPEVSFLRMTGGVLPSKKSAPGMGLRLAALGEHFGDVAALLREAPSPARADDALDALACAWTSRRVLDGAAEALGEPPMAIWS